MTGIKRILILTADAGYGHRSSAIAVAAALQETHPEECAVEIVNPLEDKRVPAPLRRSGSSYDWIVRKIPQLYKLNYEVSDSGPTTAVIHNALAAVLFQVMGDLVRRVNPDAIVTTYPVYQAPLTAVFALNRCEVPLLNVVTDYAPVHRIYFHRAADWCCVSIPAARDDAIASGLKPEKVVVTGIPVHPNLAKEARPPDAVRAELGWRPELRTALVVGGRRVKNLNGILRALNHSGLPLQLTIVAGGDEAQYREFQTVEWHLPARVLNFVENMPDLMHASDFIVCKAGGLIVTESLACGLPILLTDYIEGQETGNVRYVVEGGAGELARNPLDALEAVHHWLAHGGEMLARRGRNARSLGYPRAAYDVARLAWDAALRGPQPRPVINLPDQIEKMVKRMQ
ncbi:MAG: glycosyltransferase [Anaerolineales bacterium]|nr:glycosyltransferase [Anaerolineales bacterium]